jgi:sialidase-1
MKFMERTSTRQKNGISVRRKFAFALFAAVIFFTLTGAPFAAAKTLRIFVLTGQSNSLGTPATTETNMVQPHPGATAADKNVPFFWNNTVDGTPAGDAALGNPDLQWTNICPQRGGYYVYSADHWGPEAGFARRLWSAGYRDFAIVKASRGGGGNSFWDKTNANHTMYDKVVNTVSNAVANLPPGYADFQIVGLLYVQGESNDSAEAAQADTRFLHLLANLQADLPRAAGCKAVFGEIGGDTSGHRLLTTQKQAALAAARADIGFASSAGLTRQNVDGLNVHYDADSLIALGGRMADEALRTRALPEAAPALADVYAWFAGDTGLALRADDYSVTTWTNLGFAATNSAALSAGRNLVNLTGAPQKLYLRLTNGAPAGAVTFGGGDGIWAAKGNFGILTNHYTVIACARIRDAAPEGFLFDSTSFTPGLTRVLVWSNFWRVSAANSAGTITAPAVTNVWQIHSFVVGTNSGAAALQHFINGAPADSAAIGAPDYLSGLMIGANVSQGNGIQADVAELLVFNAALDDAARTDVENYLARKWAGVVADPNPPAPPVPYAYTPLFASGTGYPEYRIPALVTAANGTVIAVADGRQSNADIPGFIDCVCRRSFDNGHTWTPLQIIADYGSSVSADNVDTYPAYGITNLYRRRSAGDAALLLDRANGRVWVLYDNGTTNGGGRAIKLELRYSDDHGATWSPRVDVEAQNPDLRPSRSVAPEFLAGPGNGIQLTSGVNAGRLIFPVYVYGNPYYSTIIYSDDHGATWRRGGIAGNGGGEIQVVETPGGGLLASLRDNNFSWNGVRTFSRSADGGLTWSAPFTNTVPVIPDPQCQGSILRLTTTNDSDASRLVFANCDSSSARVAMTLRMSYDDGATWPVSQLVYSGVSGYSALTKMANGEVGLLNEVNNFARIDFVARSVRVISGGSDTNFSGAADFLKLQILPARGGSPPLLNFSTQSNNTYTIQTCTNLAARDWQRFADVPAQSTDAVVQLSVNPTNAAQFFRLVTPQLP